MNSYIDEMQEFYTIYTNYVNKYLYFKGNNKNHGLMLQTAGGYYEMYQKEMQQNGQNEFLEKVCDMLLEFQNFIMDFKPEEIKKLHTRFGHFLKEERNKSVEIEMVSAIMQIDIEQMKLSRQKLEMSQELIEYDKKTYGQITDLTKNLLTALHFKVENGRVEAVHPIYQENKKMEEIEKNVKEIQTQTSIPQNKKKYQVTAYLKKTTDKPTVFYGNDYQELIHKLHDWNEGRSESMKYYSCYVRTMEPATGKYENAKRYDVDTGKNITPIYLVIPYMEREEFMNTIKQLKTDGAKYSPSKKAFYITPEQNCEKFAKYIPTGPYKAHLEGEREKSDKTSVMKKLEQNKGKIKETGYVKHEKEQLRGIG